MTNCKNLSRSNYNIKIAQLFIPFCFKFRRNVLQIFTDYFAKFNREIA